MDKILIEACKKLHFGSGLAAKAKKIKADTHLEFLLQLFTSEIEERERKRRNSYMKAAKFDIIKTFEDYTFEDIKFPASLTADDIIDCNFVPKRENLILYGNVGAGKTHLAIATGIAACDAGFRTRFWRTATLVNALIEAKNKGELSIFMKQFDKLDLLICDEWGYVPKRKIPSEFFSLTLTVRSCFFRSFPNAMSVSLLSLLLISNLLTGMIFLLIPRLPPLSLTALFIIHICLILQPEIHGVSWTLSAINPHKKM